MKLLNYSVCLIFLTILLSSCQKKCRSSSYNSSRLKLLSQEIESSTPVNSAESDTFKHTHRGPLIDKNKNDLKNIVNPAISLAEKNKNEAEIISASTLPEIKPAETSGELPFNFNKHRNPFWIIGGILLIAGLAFLILSLTLLLKIARGNFNIYLWGMLLGLGLLVLSLPFILIGAIVG